MFVLFAFLLIIQIRLTTGVIILSTFQQEALNQHNFYRQMHCSPSMTLNSTLNDLAQNYSQYLALTGTFAHSSYAGSGIGENLFSLARSSIITDMNGSRAVDSWYSEFSRYNYSNPVYSTGTAHFTQIVWVNTLQMGIGFALSNDSKKIYVTANYYRGGNVQGGFAANVPQLCVSTSSVSTTTASVATGASTTANTHGGNAANKNQLNICLTIFITITLGFLF